MSSAAPVILVGVDGSEDADGVLEAAGRLAAATGRRLVVVHVAHAPAATASAPALGMGALACYAEEVADRCHLSCELHFASMAIPWAFEVRPGDPAAELLQAAADHDAACIVVGGHGHRRLGWLRPSVTDRLVMHADRPVLVVPRPSA